MEWNPFDQNANVSEPNRYLQVQMDDVLRVHVSDTFANLSHKEDTVAVGQSEIVGYDAFEQFATGDAKQKMIRKIVLDLSFVNGEKKDWLKTYYSVTRMISLGQS